MVTPIAYSCVRCGHQTFLKHTRCPKCKNVEFGEVTLTDGEVVTYTTLTATRPGYAKPLVFAIVEFGRGLRVLGQLDCANPIIGMKVKPVYGKLGERDGEPLQGLKFIAK